MTGTQIEQVCDRIAGTSRAPALLATTGGVSRTNRRTAMPIVSCLGSSENPPPSVSRHTLEVAV